MLSLGILLEVDKPRFKKACLCDREAKKEDALLDFLLKACDIGWNHNTSRYERKNPYAKTAEIIQMALHDKDKERASKRLQQYIEKSGLRDIMIWTSKCA